MSFSQSGWTIGTERSLEEVAVHEGVVDTSEERQHRSLDIGIVESRRNDVACIAPATGIVVLAGSSTRNDFVFWDALIHVVTEQNGEVVNLVERLGIVQSVFPSPAGLVLVFLINSTTVSGLKLAYRLIVCVDTCTGCSAVEGEHSLEGQTGKGHYLQIGITEEACSFDVMLISTVHLVQQRVGMCLISGWWFQNEVAYRWSESALGETLVNVFLSNIRTCDRRHLQTLSKGAGVTFFLILIGEQHVHTSLDILVEGMVNDDFGIVTLHLIVTHDTVVDHHREWSAVSSLVATTGSRDVIVLSRTRLQHLIKPIRIASALIDVHFAVRLAGGRSTTQHILRSEGRLSVERSNAIMTIKVSLLIFRT